MSNVLLHSNIQNYIVKTAKEPIRIERKLVVFRNLINRIMRNPIRFHDVTLPTGVKTRNEKYANGHLILVFTDADEVFLRPTKKSKLL